MLLGYLSAVYPNFRHPQTLEAILTNAAYVAVVAVGMTLVIVAGQIDISVGSMLAVCALVAGNLARDGVPMPLVFLASLVLGGLMGAFNGALVAYLRIPSIIVTLAMMTALRGAILWWTRGIWVQPLPPEWKWLGTTEVLGLPLPVWIAWAVVGLAAYLVAHHPWGRRVYAVGSIPTAASLAGINVPAVYFWVLCLNGVLVGLATMLNVTRFSIVQTNEGVGLEFLVITAVVVGGTNIFGGSGTILGSYLGVLLLTTLSMALIFFGVPSEWDAAFRGGLILLAVVLDILRTQAFRRGRVQLAGTR